MTMPGEATIGGYGPTTSPSYRHLIDEHVAIDRACDVVLALALAPDCRPREAALALDVLAALLRDHLAAEDEMIYQTILAARGDRHGATAAALGAELARLCDDWADYLYRWDACRIAADWAEFARDTAALLIRVRERVARETTILYSLALHHGTLDVEPGWDGVERRNVGQPNRARA